MNLRQKQKIQNKLTQTIFSEFNIIGFGSGIYGGKLHEDLFELANRLPQSREKKRSYSPHATEPSFQEP